MDKKILIIDDEPLMREPLFLRLTKEGFTVVEAENGKEGLEKAINELPDLIFLDIIMPVMDGISVLKQLKTEPLTKAIPVIMLTNLSDDKQVREVEASGGSDFLVKTNYSLEDVMKKMKETLHI